ncbi:probable RNA-binding protein EIF1AD [Anastrepha obliqua]|uniref:probable RNA-binding protein EIF1AD n=1 Tax=Anastrepha obliqua TaxID=95512 RepID=UPI0024094892|nr:probable RNA-binding protein EIF1AD [Anastrepha obliqua]
MSIELRRKHVLKEMMEDNFELPTEKQQIMRVVKCRGNNLHEVETGTPDSENILASMPNKFRRNVWIGRGDYVLVEPIEEGNKVKVEICKILTPQHIKEYSRAGVWPEQFSKKPEPDQFDIESDEEANGDELIVRNPNRPTLSEDDSTDDEEDDDETASDTEDDEEDASDKN